VLINARKQQRLFPEHLRFFACGVYELHCRADPNDPIPLILDVSPWTVKAWNVRSGEFTACNASHDRARPLEVVREGGDRNTSSLLLKCK
jgi:hypothetical protein